MGSLERYIDEMPDAGTGGGDKEYLPTDQEIHADEFRAYLRAKGVTSRTEIEDTVLLAKRALRTMESTDRS